MRLITTIALALLGLTSWAQTSLPDLPAGAQRYSQTLWLVPSDSTLWTGATGNYAQVATREQLRQLASQGYTKSQVDSAITSQIGLIDFPVTSVSGKTGVVELEASDVGLGNVDNTTDLDKPISTATQGALDGKENSFSKGSLVAGTGVTLSGTLANRLVGSGNVTINATNSLTASNGLQIISGVISPQYGTLSGTVAQGNDARINNGQTAYGWGDFRDFGLGATITSNVSDWTSYSPVENRFIGDISRSTTGKPSGFTGYAMGLNLQRATNIASQIVVDTRTGNLATRGIDGSGWTDWRLYWHSGNFTPPVTFTRSVNGLVPAPGGSGAVRYLREDGSWVDPQAGGGGGSSTDLSIQNRTATTLQIGSSTGTSATVPSATTSLAGLMSAADKTRLNNALLDYTETDPSVPNHVKNISSSDITLWDNASSYFFSTNALNANALSSHTQDWDNLSGGGAWIMSGSSSNPPISGNTANWALINLYSGANSSAQIALGVGGTNYQSGLWYRHRQNLEWRRVWDSQNFTPSDYLLASNFTWSNLSGKPSTFAPSPHSHSAADINSGTLAAARIPTLSISKISGLQSALDAKATSGTAGSQVRTNTQLDARYIQSIGAGSGISVSGTTVSLANMSANTIKGRSGSTGAPQDLTPIQVRDIINPVTTNSTTTINMQNPIQRGSARSSNTTFSLSNSSAGRQVQFHMANNGSNAIQITITGATPHGNRIIPANQSAVISIIDFGNNVISYIVVPSI